MLFRCLSCKKSLILTPENPNTIVYDTPSIRFIKAAAVAPGSILDSEAYSSFVQTASSSANREFEMGPVPYVRLEKALAKSDSLASEIRASLSKLISKYGMSPQNTVGDLSIAMVRQNLSSLGYIPNHLLDLAASKITTSKGRVAHRFKREAPDAWPMFEQLYKRNRAPFLAESIKELESIIQKIGILAFRNIEFSLKASNKDELISFVKSTRDALSQGRILTDPIKLEGIRVALERIGESEDLFEKSVEGIVFKWRGKTRKLTGLFTPINKLRGFFAYGGAQISPSSNTQNQLQMELKLDVGKRLLVEGGNAFKDAEGNHVTRLDRIPRKDVEGIVSSFKREILDPIGVDSVGVGTTVSTYPTAGDLDFVIDEISNKDVYKKLSSHPELQSEHPMAPGINRLYTLPGGAGVAVLYYAPSINDLVQVDVMPSSGADLDHISWMLKGADAGGVKSRYRNILLSLIARKQSERETEEAGQNIKYTYARGVLKKVNGKPVHMRETNPDLFLPMIGINATKESVKSFEGLVGEMRKDSFLNSILPDFAGYINNPQHLLSNDAQRRKDAQESVDYILGQNINEIRAFKNVIRLMS